MTNYSLQVGDIIGLKDINNPKSHYSQWRVLETDNIYTSVTCIYCADGKWKNRKDRGETELILQKLKDGRAVILTNGLQRAGRLCSKLATK
jgi:hypothetical protein